MDIADKTVVVTGGASGIGRAIVERFADSGADVVVADVKNASETVESADETGGEVISVETDVSDREAAEALAEHTVAAFDGIDVLVNNAGIYRSLVPKRDRSFDEIPPDEWREVLDVNTTGTFFCCQAVLPRMIAQGGGSVINVSSGVAFSGTVGYPHYVASKGAIAPLTRALAAEVGEHGVRVNAIAPGLILSAASRQLPDSYISDVVDAQCLNRRGRPDDVVDAVEFLASDHSSFISGSLLHVDGGLTRR